MSHSISASSQGMLPNFGLSAQSIPENPDTVEQTRRLLMQFCARPSVFSAKCEQRREIPRSELPQTANQAPSVSSPRHIISPPGPLPSHSPPPPTPIPDIPDEPPNIPPQPEPSSSRHLTLSPPRPPPSHPPTSSYPAVPDEPPKIARQPEPSSSRHLTLSPPAPPSPQPERAISPQHSSPARSLPRRRIPRGSVATINANRSEGITDWVPYKGPVSSTSSRAISPVESNVPRRSVRSRAQPINYFARGPLDFDEPEVSTSATPVYEPCPPMNPQQPSRLKPRKNLIDFLHARELGGRPFDMDITSDLKPWKSWKGASGDIFVAIWSPDGTRFAAGAGAHNDEYNKSNNFVLGNLQTSCLKEIPDHRIPRPNASSLQDPRLYMSVTDMQWTGDRLSTASYDKNVKIWDTSMSDRISCLGSLKHDSGVELIAVSSFDSNILATGCDVGSDVVRVWDTRDLGNPTFTVLPIDRPNATLKAGALAWGDTPASKEFLAGGMSDAGVDSKYKGYLGLWRACEDRFESIKVSKNSQTVHDLKWHSSLPQFITASPVDPHYARIMGIGTARSIVRVFNVNEGMRVPSIMEFSCPADDVNEVTFSPAEGNYVTASCTNGVTYVWDDRRGDRILHELRHGDPINPIAHDSNRESEDVGVKVALWGLSTDQFFTGASDGVLKRWDVRRSTEDVLLRDITTMEHGLFSASFSPDQAHLLIGDSGGGIHVLSSGPCADPEITDFRFEYAPEIPTDGPNQSSEVGTSGNAHEALDVSMSGILPQEAASARQSVPSQPLRSEKKRRRSEKQKQKAKSELFVDVESDLNGSDQNEVNEVNKDKSIVGEGHEEIGISSNETEPKTRDTQADSRRIRRRKKRRLQRMQHIITHTESIDLTLDSDSDTPRQFQMEQLLEALEEDHWFPESGSIDPNITVETV